MEGPVVGQGLAGLAVVVHDKDVIVRMTALAVDVRHDEGVRVRVHLFRPQVAKGVDPLDVLGLGRVELVGAEALPVVECLDLAVGCFDQRPGEPGPSARSTGDVTADRDATVVVDAPDVDLRGGRRSAR